MYISLISSIGLLFLMGITPLFAQHQLQASFDDRVNDLMKEMKVDTQVHKAKKGLVQERQGLIKILKTDSSIARQPRDIKNHISSNGQSATEKDKEKSDIEADESESQAALIREMDINCGIDDFEDNQTRSRGKNIILSDPNIQELQLFAKICPFDHDWFSFSIEQGEMVQIQLLIDDSAWFQAQKSMLFKALEVFAPRARRAMKYQVKKEKKLQENGKYILQELTFFANKTGRYKLLIQALWQENQEISYELRLKKKEKKRAH